jgi:NADP-dependent 3-hydroxy acid dehydrogenase YdfG
MAVENKVVVITGASSGIGEATAMLPAEKGAKILLGARREDRLKELAGEIIITNGGQAVYRQQTLLILIIISSLFQLLLGRI